MRALLLGLGLLSALLAGCAGGRDGGDPPSPTTPPAVEPDWAAKAVPFGGSHSHRDPAHHQNLTTPNFEVVGYDPMMSAHHGATSGGHYCGDVGRRSDGMRLAVTHSFTSDVGLLVLDVTEAAKPAKIGELVMPRTHVYDAALVPDGSFAVLATNPPRASTSQDAAKARDEGPLMIIPEWTDACGTTTRLDQEPVPYGPGVVLVDLANPRQPRVADFFPQPVLGAHSVFATILDGQRFVLASTTNLEHRASYFTFLRIDDLPSVGPRLVEYGTYDAQYVGTPAGSPALINGHVDGWIQKHPITKENLAYLANWDGGLIVVRLAGPGRIENVANWNDYDPSKGDGMTGQIHDALPIEGTWDGRHYTFIGQEILNRPSNRPTGQVILLDTTDPGRPSPKARWTLPVDVQWSTAADELIFSTHYIEVVNRTLFVSLYHGGVWAVDASQASWPDLATLGVFIPDRVPPKVRAGATGSPAPEVLDVLALDNGHLVSYDARGGAYVLRFKTDVEVPIPAPWTKDKWISG